MERKTTLAKPADVKREWFLVDAAGKPLGRLATQVAQILMGKHRSTYTPNVDTGDYVVLINAAKVSLSGNKLKNKKYYNVSGYNGGLRTRTAGEMIEQYPEEMVKRCIWGMIPKGRLGRQMIKKLFVYRDEKHSHEAQKPKKIELL